MSHMTSRVFHSSAKHALKRLGASNADIHAQNPGKDVTKVIHAIEKIEKHAEEKYGHKAAYLKVQGGKLHKSSKDPHETLEVITVSIETEKGTRLESDHARSDGTSTQKVTRAGGHK